MASCASRGSLQLSQVGLPRAQPHTQEALFEARITPKLVPLRSDGEVDQGRIVPLDRLLQVMKCRVHFAGLPVE
jgi:hypothetical protein